MRRTKPSRAAALAFVATAILCLLVVPSLPVRASDELTMSTQELGAMADFRIDTVVSTGPLPVVWTRTVIVESVYWSRDGSPPRGPRQPSAGFIGTERQVTTSLPGAPPEWIEVYDVPGGVLTDAQRQALEAEFGSPVLISGASGWTVAKMVLASWSPLLVIAAALALIFRFAGSHPVPVQPR